MRAIPCYIEGKRPNYGAVLPLSTFFTCADVRNPYDYSVFLFGYTKILKYKPPANCDYVKIPTTLLYI